jgi:hypothetical protein
VSGELELAFGAGAETDTHVLADRWGMTEPEVRYALAYADTLAVGDAEPPRDGLDPERVWKIRRALEQAWWLKVKNIRRRR